MQAKDMLVVADARDASDERHGIIDVTPERLCKRWYSAFGRKDIDGLMALFAPDARVLVGAGGSNSAVDYCGTYVGTSAIREFYERRFASGEAPARYACGIHETVREVKPWVVFSGNIIDRTADGQETYHGPFLHVWTIDQRNRKIRSLEMYFDPI